MFVPAPRGNTAHPKLLYSQYCPLHWALPSIRKITLEEYTNRRAPCLKTSRDSGLNRNSLLTIDGSSRVRAKRLFHSRSRGSGSWPAVVQILADRDEENVQSLLTYSVIGLLYERSEYENDLNALRGRA